MDILDSARDYLSILPAVQAWPEVAAVMQRVPASFGL